MFKVNDYVVLRNSSQNKVMKIQAYSDEFIRAYCGDQDYSFAHESNFRHATPEEIAAGHRIDKCKCVATRTYENGTCNKCGLQDMGDDSDLEYHVSKNCKVIDYD